MHFWKYQGTGNDFIVLEDDADRWTDEAIAAACDRHFGVGADGILFVGPGIGGADGQMIVRNADGSRPEMCGNGLRCVALHVARRKKTGALRIATDAGIKECHVLFVTPQISEIAKQNRVQIRMGRVVTTGSATLAIDGEELALTLADAGNPHAIHFATNPEARSARFGYALATHPHFPRGTNAEFAEIVPGPGGGSIDLVVWERGVGRTLACGTGACATAVAAWDNGLLPRGKTEVRLPGGALTIAPDGDDGVTLEGGAVLVFEGELPE